MGNNALERGRLLLALFVLICVFSSITSFRTRAFGIRGYASASIIEHASSTLWMGKKTGGSKGGKGGKAKGGSATVEPVMKMKPVVSAPDPVNLQAADRDEDGRSLSQIANFKKYYQSSVDDGKDMDFATFRSYGPIENLLEEALVQEDDLLSLWASAVGDAAGLDEDEAYEMLCMVEDLPDPEDNAFLDEEFNKLRGNKETISYAKFIGWSDVQEMLEEEVLTIDQLNDVWTETTGGMSDVADRVKFTKLNNALDDLIDDVVDGVDDSSAVPTTQQGGSESEREEEVLELAPSDVWKPSFDPVTVFDSDALDDITNFFEEESSENGLTYNDLMAWEDIKELIAEGAIIEKNIEALWDEAPKNKIGKKQYMDFDTFKRFNVRLDMVIDDIEASQSSEVRMVGGTSTGNSDGDESPEVFYRKEFERICRGQGLIDLQDLLAWEEIKELIADGAVTAEQITRMYNSMPLEEVLGGTASGIKVDTFIAFNGMLDVMLDSADTNAEKEKASAPVGVLSEEERPMPKEGELRMGSSGMDDNRAENTGLSEDELAQLEILDAADNMLNTGGFSDFDLLIGDVSDPRLDALRMKEMEGKTAIEGDVKQLVQELLTMSKKQSRCGLDTENELYESDLAYIRDRIEGIIEKSPRAANRDINELRETLNGEWDMLYSNSEMFRFYNGITGFVNVFPASKFKSLHLKYESDGYLSENKYFEELETPLGLKVATVYSTWELQKEMSFMTNDNTVVLRSFCEKVTAGPFEYEAQENWKSLRTMSMNEVVYVDEDLLLMRNCGALRIFFVAARRNSPYSITQ